MHTITAAVLCLLMAVGLSHAQTPAPSKPASSAPSTSPSTSTAAPTTTTFNPVIRSGEVTALSGQCTPLTGAAKCAKQVTAMAGSTAENYCGLFNEVVGCLAAECNNYSSKLQTEVEAHKKKYNCNSAPRVLMASISLIVLAVIGSFTGSKF